ncbi:MAG: SLC13 family permease [Candidatus Hodarchaeales archaeon]|jgi:sodium-dependent dicarboxylate transporter 2/3/5
MLSNPENKISQKKVIIVIFAFGVFFLGYFLAPPTMNDGYYEGNVTYRRDNASIEVDFLFILNSSIDVPKNPKSTSNSSDNYQIVVNSFESYSGKIGNKIIFIVTINNTQNVTDDFRLTNFVASISKANFKENFSPKELTNQEFVFEFQIIKYSDVTLGLLFTVSILWMTEIIPLSASALLIPVAIVIFNIDTATGSLSLFFSPIIILFFAGFLMAEAMKRVKLDTFLSVTILSIIPANTKLIVFSMMVLSAIFSMFMSNTAAVAIFIPLSLSLLEYLDKEYLNFRKMMILGIAYASTIGGIGSLIGTPPNYIAVDLLQKSKGITISFIEWFIFGFPVLILLIPITFLYLWIRLKPSISNEAMRIAKLKGINRKREFNTLSKDQIVVLLIFVFVFCLWLMEQFHGIHAGIIAVTGVILLYFSGYLIQEDLTRINWNALLTFGGGLTLGAIILRTGLADWLALQLGFLKGVHPFFILLFLGLLSLILTGIASNTASASILVPIVIPLGITLGIDPVLTALVVAIVASVDFAIIIGTPPTMVAYSTGYFQVKEIFKLGIVLDLIGLIVVTLLGWFFYQNVLFLVK